MEMGASETENKVGDILEAELESLLKNKKNTLPIICMLIRAYILVFCISVFIARCIS